MTRDDQEELIERTIETIAGTELRSEERHRAEEEGWAQNCWEAMSEAGFAWVGVPEAQGGSGGTVVEAGHLLRQVGRHAIPLPLAECTVLGGWLLAGTGRELQRDGPISVPLPHRSDRLVLDRRGRLDGVLNRVPWGSQVPAVVAIASASDGDHLVVIDPSQAEIRPGRNVAGEPRDALHLDGVALPEGRNSLISKETRQELLLRGALSRALLMAGAMETAATMTIDYAVERRQFGRSIASFQAVGHRLVQLRAEVEAASLAATWATQHFAGRDGSALFEVAIAKVMAGRAASEAVAHAHQVHGAVGMTQEYPLHYFTRRLVAWRMEWGTDRYWAGVVGATLAERASSQLWPHVTADLVER